MRAAAFSSHEERADGAFDGCGKCLTARSMAMFRVMSRTLEQPMLLTVGLYYNSLNEIGKSLQDAL